MKALVYEKAHILDSFAIQLVDVAEPTLRDSDVLVDIRAIGINPGEAFIRKTRSAAPGGRVLLGWEFAGVVIGAGLAVRDLKTGDRVFGTGDMSRDGAWAERVAVDIGFSLKFQANSPLSTRHPFRLVPSLLGRQCFVIKMRCRRASTACSLLGVREPSGRSPRTC
jgi:NADPH:quinone reductase-like Zn-dependent oxidoreductase